MDEARVSTAPPAESSQTRVASRGPARRGASLRRRLILRLPELALLVVLAALALGGGLQLATGGGHATGSAATVSNQVYTVDQVRAGLTQDPSAWVGHTILVRGVLQGPLTFCGQANPCPPETLGLMDDGNAILAPDQYLPVVAQASLDIQRPRYNVPATYRVLVRATPAACALNPSILCYQGTILGGAQAQ